ncbi:hypothetical protein [Paenibacillus daejeonensis]|uniref:hypothetical protein n=1 Tax=Paenibacillus daejeonensis TaxID=135193 RepID=UPI001B7FC94E|nr:hypothetical protein [Paenibacillus daejeonensis]
MIYYKQFMVKISIRGANEMSHTLISPPLAFEVLEHDRVIAKVQLDYRNQTVQVWQDESISPVFLPFPAKQKVQVSDVLDYFESRCFPRTRHHREKVLQALGLREYVPTDIVKKTHGVLYDDYVWIRFAGEELRCVDVHPRFASEQEPPPELCNEQ